MTDLNITTLLIADDHPIFRLGIREAINASDRYNVVAEAKDGVEAIEKIKLYQPDIALLDISMPEMGGLDVLVKSLSWADVPKFIILTMYDDKVYLEKALEYGALGYILKDNAEEEVISCLNMVAINKPYITPSITQQHQNTDSKRESLSSTEKKVLMLVSDHKTNAEIAELLSASIRTIENHRAHICKKLDLHGPHALTRYVLDQNNET